MIHKEDDRWVGKYNSFVALVSDYFNGGSGDTATLYDIEKFLRAYFHPMQSKISTLEKENSNLKEQVSRLLEEKARFESIINEYREFIRCQD